MFIVYMLPYYIEVFYYVSIGKILKCGMCWCVLLSYVVVRCVLVTYSGRNTSRNASKPPPIGATGISFQAIMLYIAYDASIMPQSNLVLLPPAYATLHASKGHLCYKKC